MADENKCIICGCTYKDCSQCIERTGEPCCWLSDNETMCSACEKEIIERIEYLNFILRKIEKDSPEEIVRMLKSKKEEIQQKYGPI